MILMAQPSCIKDPIQLPPAPPHSAASIPTPPQPHHPSVPPASLSIAHVVPASLASRSSQHTTRSRSSNDSSRSRPSVGKRASTTSSGSRRAPSKSKSKARANNVLLNGTSAVNNAILSAAALAVTGSGNSPGSNTNADAIADPKRTSSSSASQTQMKRTSSSGRIPRMPYAANGGLLSGTIQRSKVGGRVAATSSSFLGGTGKSLYDSHASHRTHNQAMPKKRSKEAQRDVSVLPTPTSVASVHRPSPMHQQQQHQDRPAPPPHASASTTVNGHVPSTRRSSSSARSRKSNGSGKAAKLVSQSLLGAVAASKRPFDTEYSDDSSDTDWTDDGSEEGSGGSNEHGRVPEGCEDQDQGAEAQAEHDRMLAFAAAEEERERSLFAKLDKRSYTDLNRSRTQPSLLSMIFHPDPQLFPPDHPYRHTRSTQDILAHAAAPRSPSSAATTSSATSARHTAFQPPRLQTMTKGSTAGPVQATVVASSVSTSSMNHEGGQPRQRSPLRLRGKPENVDVEESDSESEANDLHMSKSVAHQRLAMLHKQQNGRRDAVAAAQANGNGKFQNLPPKMRTQENVTVATVQPAALSRVATEPITMQYPYNLPAPQAPSTPRTTRRTMLTHELSESLRRNLLWERQVSRLRPVGNGVYRRNSAGTQNGAGTQAVNGNASGGAPSANGSGSNASGSGAKTGEEEERRRRMERNKSWADTYHTSGW